MTPCNHCDQYVIGEPSSCPHCGISSGKRKAATLVVLGILVAGTAGCARSQYMYGYASTPSDFPTEADADGDGYSPPEDCADDDETIHPDAEDEPGDGIDSNCDGED